MQNPIKIHMKSCQYNIFKDLTQILRGFFDVSKMAKIHTKCTVWSNLRPYCEKFIVFRTNFSIYYPQK